MNNPGFSFSGKGRVFVLANEKFPFAVFDFLRFPLIVGVVLQHANLSNLVVNHVKVLNGSDFPVFYYAFYLISTIIVKPAVPLFFAISGYLFFCGLQRFDFNMFLGKLKRRVRSLLVPYVFWNLIILFSYFVAQSVIPDMLSGRDKLLTDYSLSDWLWAFWDTSKFNENDMSMPVNYPLWFVRDLMVVVCLSPVIYFLIKKLKLFAVLALGLIWLSGDFNLFVGLNFGDIFFFSLGAYACLCKENVSIQVPWVMPVVLILYIFIVSLELYLKGSYSVFYIHEMGILVGGVLVWSLSSRFVISGRWHSSRLLSQSSFFIFVFHAMPLTFVIRILLKLVSPFSEVSLLFVYFVSPVITSATGLLLFMLMKRYTPRFLNCISGGRVDRA